MALSERPVLVLGATGGQGGAVVDALIERQVPVRSLVRDPASASARGLAARGIEVVPGSLYDRDSVVSAMRGVAGAFAVTTPFESGTDAEIEQGRTILAASHESRLPHLVFSSVAGATQDSGVPHFESKAVIERDVAAGDVPYTILGPVYFFDNALGGRDRILDGVLDLALPSHRALQQLARPDLGQFAAAVLLAPEDFAGQRIELASDDPTPSHMATALGRALGRTVRHEEVPLDTIDNRDMHAMWTFLRGPGYQVDIPALQTSHTEVDWTSFDTWADSTMGVTS